jgi:hypothetical protein
LVCRLKVRVERALARAFRWRRMSDVTMHATLEDLGAERRNALHLPSHV